jgi:hypothetical protein
MMMIDGERGWGMEMIIRFNKENRKFTSYLKYQFFFKKNKKTPIL